VNFISSVKYFSLVLFVPWVPEAQRPRVVELREPCVVHSYFSCRQNRFQHWIRHLYTTSPFIRRFTVLCTSLLST